MRQAPSSTSHMVKKSDMLLVTLLLLLLGTALAATAKRAAAVRYAGSEASALVVSKSVDTLQPLPDQIVTFSIAISNTGVVSATNGTLTDNLDTNLSFIGPVNIEGGGGTATAGSPPAIASGLTISPSTSVTITFPVRIQSNLPGGSEIKNTAVAESSEFATATSNEVTLTVSQPADVTWRQRSTGIFGGQVNVLAVDRFHTATVYAGTPVGFFRSDDGGLHWAAANTGLQNLQVESLAVDPLHGGLLYAGTQGGAFKSSNSGQSWVSANDGLGGSSISSLVIDPGQPDILYAGTEVGVFKSMDGGSSWIDASAGLSNPVVTSLAIDPRHSNTLYAGTEDSGVFKSSDGGGSWAPANSGLANLTVHVLATDPLKSDTLYAGTGAGLFKSENGGRNWSAAGADLINLAIFALSIDPSSSSHIYAGTESGIAKSSSGGNSWSLANQGETKTLAIDPVDPAVLFAGTAEKGVLKSEDSASSWAAMNEGLTGGEISALAIRPADSNLIFAGTPGKGVFKSSSGGGSWEGANNGLSDLNVYGLTMPAGNNSLLYAGTGGGVFKSVDNGESWTAVNNGLANKTVHAVGIHPTKSQVLYAGTAGGGVFRSNNGGDSWFAANSGLTDLHVFDLAIDPNDGQILYAGTKSGGVFKSSDGGSTWAAMNSGLTAYRIETLAIDPANSQLILAGGPDGLFKSSDAGGSWAASGGGLEDAAIQDLVFDAANSTIVYAATAGDGVFRSTGGGFNWTAVNEGLTVKNVRALLVVSPNSLYAGTIHGGVFFSGASLAVSKQADKINPNPGESLLYTILISNTGDDSITGATVNDTLNGKLKFTGPITIEGGGLAAKAGTPPQLASNLTIEPGNTATVTYGAQVMGGLTNGTVIPNTATVNAPQLPAPTSAQEIITVYQSNGLVINKKVDDPSPLPGQIINFTIEINNTAPHGVGGINVTDALDGNLTFLGPVEIIGSYGTPGSPPLLASGMGISPGRKIIVRFPARVKGTVLPGTMIDNMAQLTSITWPVPISSQVSLLVGDPAARHIYVDQTADTGLNDGSSWENAYTSLQDALVNAGSGSEIWVAAGTYYPDEGSVFAANDPAATFQLRSGVAIYGGFAGIESSLEERDPASHLTLLSGDIDGNDSGTCDQDHGVEMISGTNSTHVVTSSGVNSSAILDGFTISAGDARGTGRDQHGGGLINEQGSPSLANLIFCGSRARGSGGGMFNDAGSPTLNGITFVNNESAMAGGHGGGMANINGSLPTLENVEFNGNQANYGGGMFNASSKVSISGGTFDGNRALWGGGIFNVDGSDGTFSDLSIISNEASGGGGMVNDHSSPRLTNTTWAGNMASQWGGGLAISGGDPVLINSVFSGNLAEAQSSGQQSWGGGMYVAGGYPTLANATLAGNWAAAKGTRPTDEGLGGGLFVAAGEVTIHNSIFWNNEGDRTPDLLVAAGGATKIKSSRLDGCPQFSVCGGLVNADPQFVLPVDPTSAPTVSGNLSLQPGSALVDAGDNSLVPAGVSTDRAGEARIYHGVVDLGAFELPIACPEPDTSRLYVDSSVAGGDNSGIDWPNALDDLSHAFALAGSCQESRIGEIWVAAGRYVPVTGAAAAGMKASTFQLRDGLAVYGGFAGTELVLQERDWLQNLTILSGDLEGDDEIDASGLVTDTMKIAGSNSYHVVTSMGNDPTAVLDGFFINAGQANGAADVGDDSGGGIYNEASSPTLRHLVILANTAGDGGGIANISSSNPTLTNVRLQGNRATFFGGGLFNQSSSPELTNVALFDNQASGGGGVFNTNSSPMLVNTTVAGNKAGSTDVAGYLLESNPRAQDLARAAGSGGGLYNLNNSRPVITNSIFWQNEDGNGSSSESASIGNDAGSIPLISYSLIQASGGSGDGWNGSMGFDLGQNIDEDPLFFAGEDRHLLPGSPAIDAGENEANHSDHDLDVRPRITDGTNDGEAVIDLGAYETTLVAILVSSTPNTTAAKVGDTVTFTYIVTNDGQVTLKEIQAADDQLGEIPLAATTLAPGESTSGTLSYTLQESDIGTMVFIVTVTGKSDAGALVSAEDTVAIEVKPSVYRSFTPFISGG